MLDTAGLSDKHAIWLEETRKIPCEIAAAAGVTTFEGKLTFEFRRNGELMYRKHRLQTPTGKSFRRDRDGVPSLLFNEDCLSEAFAPHEPLVITEGEIDALSWMAAGIGRVVSVPDGAQLSKPGEGEIVPGSDGAFRYLWDGDALRKGLQAPTKIILSTDADDKGYILRDELAVRLGRAKCWFIEYPKDCKDANDVLVKHGREALLRLIDNAKPIVPSKLVPFSDIPRKGNKATYSSGMGDLDNHLKLNLPELMVVTGSPNAGKSLWTVNYVCNLARLHSIKTAILQFEDDVDRNREDIERYVTAFSKPGNTKPITKPDVWIDEMFRTISPAEENDSYDMDWLRASIIEASTRHGCHVILIDPFNEIEHLWKVNETETQYLNNCLRDLKKLARQLQIAIIIVTHPTKSGGSSKPVEEWSLYDVSGGATWNNKADHGVVIWREDNKSPDTYVKVCKSKNFRTMGTPGTVVMQYDLRSSCFFQKKVA